jgi:hypothetical protein
MTPMLIMREEGACYDEVRLFENSLSSMPMCFNVFAPLAMDLGLANRVFRLLLPDVKEVRGIRFETSPGRHEARFLNDGTAFDLAVDVTAVDDVNATIFAELKLSETMEGPAARYRDRYDEASRAVGLYVDPDAAILRSLALEQLFREHELAQLAVDAGVTPRAMFIAIGPRLNRRVQAAFRCYANELIPDDDLDDSRVRFRAITLETVVDAIRQVGAVELATMLWARYCDFERVFHLCMAEYANEHAELSHSAEPSRSEAKPRNRRRPSEAVHAG